MRARVVLLAASTALLAALLAGPATALAAKRPNLILITSDDQTLATYTPGVMPQTARKLGRKGTTFTNAIVTTPQCCPSRATMITGQYAHNHGVLSNKLNYGALVDKGNTLPVWLHGAGYETVHVGKYLNGYEAAAASRKEVAPGWDRWFTTLGGTRYYDYDVAVNGRTKRYGDDRHDDYVTSVITEKASAITKRVLRSGQPLYMQVDHRAPHTETGHDSGGRCGGRAVPDKRDNDLYRDAVLPQPPGFNEVDVADKPSYIRSRPLLTPEKLKKMTKRYGCGLAALRGVDRSVKEIFKAVKKAGELDNTVIAFISDNGYFEGQHRVRVGKIYGYEEAIRVPMVVRMPPRYRAGAPILPETNAPVANIDLAPTFLELAGAEPCAAPGQCRTMDGRSLVSLMNGNADRFPSDRGLVTEFSVGVNDVSQDGLCRYSGVRVQGAVYLESTEAGADGVGCKQDPTIELYDLSADPFELTNRAVADPPIGSLQRQLANRLDSLRGCAGLAGRDTPVDGRPFCE